ncbi:MAG: hypothetical protein IJX69_01315 [Oscillospiraceae bacterium]|nr:hypothetical protein [Oscillospiraceae bacterium]
MIYVIAKLDGASRARLSWIQSFAASFGIVPKPIYGHITLAQWEGDEDSFIASCKTELADQCAFSVSYETIEYRKEADALVAAARNEGEIAAVSGKLKQWQDDGWTPDTVLLQDKMTNLSWVRSAMGQMFAPFTATVDRIEFVRGVSGGFEVLDALALKGE